MASDVSGLLAQMPALEGDKRIKSQEWGFMTDACKEALERPTDNVVGIIAQIADTDAGKDYRARYLLHGIVTVAGNPGNEAKLEEVVTAIASQLQADRVKAVKGFLIRELRFCATPSAAKAIAPFLTDADLCSDAANALRSIKVGATALLVAALPKANGACKTELIHALAALGEPEGLAAIQGALNDPEQNTRLAAAWGIAQLADASSADALLKAADGAKDWERIQLTDSCLRLAEKLTAVGKKAEAGKIYSSLQATRTDASEAYIKAAATKALAG